MGHAGPQVDGLGPQLDLALVPLAVGVYFAAHHEGLDVQTWVPQAVLGIDGVALILLILDFEALPDDLQGGVEQASVRHHDAYAGLVGDLSPGVGVPLEADLLAEAAGVLGTCGHLAGDPLAGGTAIHVCPSGLHRLFDVGQFIQVALKCLIPGQWHGRTWAPRKFLRAVIPAPAGVSEPS